MTDARSWTANRKALVLSIVVIVLLATGAVLMTSVITRHRRAERPRPVAVALQTTKVVRRTLSNDLTLPGQLRYVGSFPLTGHGTGTITQLPGGGQSAERGTVLYRVDDQPVAVLIGNTPLFRELKTLGTQGADVAMLADNLRQLGYFDGWFPANPHEMKFTALLRTALTNWQRAIGMAPTGTLEIGQAVVLPMSQRVSAVTAHLGDPADGPIATMSSETQVAALSVQPTEALPIRDQTPVQIVLASGVAVAGTVTDIQSTPASGQDASVTPPPTNITVTPQRQQSLRGTGSGAVQVLITTERHSNVLTVAISALLALKGGTSYAVQLPGGQLIGVTIGMFTADYVEISGPGLVAGMSVVTAT